ncbi:MAG TPA: ATP-grasp domain-containing protein [Pyrinomonadaceae bacterium]|nr:ATP-grasp domain-containing protein [Pyrinomonadaceae bacterium]
MTNSKMPTILCIASFFKGNEFIRECKRRGAGVVLLTREKLLGAEWARDSLDDLIAIPGKTSVQSYLAAATYVARQRRVVRVVALEEYDVVTAAHIREHLCLPGMGTTTARSFQDKLAMRCRASEVAIHQPQFVPLVNYDVVDEFMKQTSPPWMLKPRIGASSMGIKKLYDPEAVWRALADLDAREAVHERSDFHLLEQFIPGHVYHVDSLVAAGKVLFASVERYGAPPFDVSHCGGVPLSYFVKYGSREQRALLALNKKLLKGFGFEQGVTHAEFIRPAASTQYPNEPFIFLRLQHESAAPIQLTLSRRRRVSIFGANGPVLNSPRPSVRTFCHLCALSMAALRYHWHVRRTLPLVAMTIPRSFIV